MDWTGISKISCPVSCVAEACVISGKPRCCHPCMGGVPEAYKDDPVINDRYAEACSALGVSTKRAALAP